MQQPKIPFNERIRLSNLQELDILDTPAGEKFDRLTHLARRMFNVPVALVSLVDTNRQWFSSGEAADAGETGQDTSFCGYAILGDDIFQVSDASKDERFYDSPQVKGPPHIRFYAGCPLRHPNGSKLGTVCIMDYQPRTLGAEDMADLRYLAEMVEKELVAVQTATIDPLTGLPNRKGFLTLANKSLSLCRRQEISVSLAFLDLDSFNLINERYGNEYGDRALKAFAELLSESFRDSDILGRLDNDEFLLLLNNTSLKQAEKVMQVFSKTLDIYNKAPDLPFEINFTWGAVNIPVAEQVDLDALIREADKEMHRQKSQESVQAKVLAWKAINYYKK